MLEVGCGSFDTAFELARLVGRMGIVIGLDPCVATTPLVVQQAHARAPSNASITRGDVHAPRFEQPFDRVFVHLMTACFSDPRPALGGLRSALRSGGALIVLTAVPDAPGGCGPSPFASADPETVRSIVERAGYCDVAIGATLAPRGRARASRAWCVTARSPA